MFEGHQDVREHLVGAEVGGVSGPTYLSSWLLLGQRTKALED